MKDVIVAGVNEAKLDKLIIEISDISDRIKSKLNEIDKLVNDTSNYFVCESGTNFRNKFELNKENFQIIYKNISNITSDLVHAKVRFKNVKEKNIENLKLAKTDVQSKSLEEYKI